MSKKNITDYINYDFHTPNDNAVREYLEENFQTSGDSWEEECGYITPLDYYVYNTYTKWGKFIPTQDFKQLIGMAKKEVAPQFTKSSLKDGMVVTTRNGSVYTVTGDRLLREGGMYFLLEDINDDLTSVLDDERSLDIISVQQTVTLFKRETEAELKQQRIAKELEFAEAKRERLNAHIERLKKNLSN